jgi:uncharacterized membrane protein YbhN (UPF0104 family)
MNMYMVALMILSISALALIALGVLEYFWEPPKMDLAGWYGADYSALRHFLDLFRAGVKSLRAKLK